MTRAITLSHHISRQPFSTRRNGALALRLGRAAVALVLLGCTACSTGPSAHEIHGSINLIFDPGPVSVAETQAALGGARIVRDGRAWDEKWCPQFPVNADVRGADGELLLHIHRVPAPVEGVPGDPDIDCRATFTGTVADSGVYTLTAEDPFGPPGTPRPSESFNASAVQDGTLPTLKIDVGYCVSPASCAYG